MSSAVINIVVWTLEGTCTNEAAFLMTINAFQNKNISHYHIHNYVETIVYYQVAMLLSWYLYEFHHSITFLLNVKHYCIVLEVPKDVLYIYKKWPPKGGRGGGGGVSAWV